MILSELHDISHMIIETGADSEMSALDLIEESLRVIRAVDKQSISSLNIKTKDKKEKKLLH